MGWLSPLASWMVLASVIYLTFKAAFWLTRKL